MLPTSSRALTPRRSHVAHRQRGHRTAAPGAATNRGWLLSRDIPRGRDAGRRNSARALRWPARLWWSDLFLPAWRQFLGVASPADRRGLPFLPGATGRDAAALSR